MFCALNGVKHVRCAPYHPSSNGQAECTEQTIKTGLKKSQVIWKLDYCVSHSDIIYLRIQQWVSYQQCYEFAGNPDPV